MVQLLFKGRAPSWRHFFFHGASLYPGAYRVGTYYQENLMKCWEGVNILVSDIPYKGVAIPLVASCYRAIFKQVSKVIQDCTGCTLLRSVIGPENLRHPLNQSEAKLKPTMGWSPTFSRASGSLLVLTLSSNWLRRESTVMLSFVVTDLRDYFVFG